MYFTGGMKGASERDNCFTMSCPIGNKVSPNQLYQLDNKGCMYFYALLNKTSCLFMSQTKGGDKTGGQIIKNKERRQLVMMKLWTASAASWLQHPIHY